MDQEKSSNSSFEDLSNLNDNEQGLEEEEKEEQQPQLLDIIGNGQLTKKVLSPGIADEKPMRGDLCTITYTGRLEDGTIVESEENRIIQSGDVEIVQGLDMAIPLMQLKEKAEVMVDGRFAYGALGLVNENDPKLTIPPNAKIIYEIELIAFKEESDLETKGFESRKRIGNMKRERGNFWYARNEDNLAIQLYRRALEYLDEIGTGETSTPLMTTAELQELLEDRVKVFNNLAAAQMRISAFDTALKSIENVLRCQPNNVKALFRKGKILGAKNNTSTAIPILQKAAALDPNNKDIQKELSKFIFKSRQEARNEKDMYQKMLGHAQKLEQKSRKNITGTQDIPKLKLWGYLMGSILIGVAGVAIYRYKYF